MKASSFYFQENIIRRCVNTARLKSATPLRFALVPICGLSTVHRSVGLRKPAGNVQSSLRCDSPAVSHSAALIQRHGNGKRDLRCAFRTLEKIAL